ncbi:MAG: TonB-dependent receptor, partial [Chloroflexi bacterium]|nr:TonB-dependent receptor [Chloroflexota bacterium]
MSDVASSPSSNDRPLIATENTGTRLGSGVGSGVGAGVGSGVGSGVG